MKFAAAAKWRKRGSDSIFETIDDSIISTEDLKSNLSLGHFSLVLGVIQGSQEAYIASSTGPESGTEKEQEDVRGIGANNRQKC